ncbi:MAG: glyoxylase-like metal-dependent hydrolase (beta-lactamase superfamily II) [Saprospiraceae bacterium]|jgi:glyoxylase-like metal-dependent hydrolase (beta-lactamase superfamily II)
MKLSTINTGFFKLDGGAMFGVVPKQLWQRLSPPDENNMCTWAMRCLLIENGDRKILVDCGLGEKQDDRFRSHFEPHGEDSLMHSLADKGLTPEDITDVFLTHLHFDHCGGAVMKDKDGNLLPSFPNATYWSNKTHYDWAMNPNPRERASFLKENFVPLQDAGILKFVDESDGKNVFDHIDVKFVYGHTEAMMTLYIHTDNFTLVYCADVIPSSYHIGLPYVMSYDVRPLFTMTEKTALLEEAVREKQVLFFEHDPKVACATVRKNEKGRIVIDEVFSLEELTFKNEE